MNDGRAQDLVLSRGEGAVVSEAEVERTLKLLDAIAQDGLTVSQRDLSERLGIALGLVNSYLKRLARKGCIKEGGITSLQPVRGESYLWEDGCVTQGAELCQLETSAQKRRLCPCSV